MKKRTKVAIALGSNLGDRRATIAAAYKEIQRHLSDSNISEIFETRPWGVLNQPDFLNAVVVGWTDLSPTDLLRTLKSLEKDLGRTKNIQNGPREIDLDVVAFGNEVINGEHLEIPHPRMHDRDFVLLPLCELWPDWVHPVLKCSVEELKIKLGSDPSPVVP